MVPDDTIRISHQPGGDIWQVDLRGEHDLSTAARVADALEELPATSRVIVDLSEATFIDCAIIRLLVERADQGRPAGGTLAVVVGRDTAPRRVIDMIGLDHMLPVHDTLPAALADHGSGKRAG